MTTTPDFRALCAELLDELDFWSSWHDAPELKARARAALATPPPEPPTDEELDALWIEQYGWTGQLPAMSIAEFKPAARAVLGRRTAENNAPQSGMDDGARAHRTRLLRDVQIAIGEAPLPNRSLRLSDCQHLSMGRGVLQLLDLVARSG